MKRFFITFGLLAAAAIALTNCTQKESYAPVQEEAGELTSLQITANLPVETKTYNQDMSTMWSKGDQLKLSFTLLGGTNVEVDSPFTTIEGDGVFTGSVDWKFLLGNLNDIFNVSEVSAVYPYSENGGYVIPKSTVQNGYDSKAHLAGANCPLVGTVPVSFKNIDLSDLSNITTSIPAVKLNHTTSIVEVNVTNASKSEIVIGTVGFRVGSDIKGFTDVENGTSLEVGKSAKVYIVIEPCTVAAGNGDDSKLTFWVNNTSKEFTIENDVTFTAGKIKKVNFAYEGDFPDLYAVADVDVEMTADRIVPCVKTLIDYNYLKEWACNLKNQEDIETVLTEALGAVMSCDLDKAYEILGGIPGFEHQFTTLAGSARHIEKVNYKAADYLKSFVEDIKKVNDIASLLKLLEDFERYYEVSGVKSQIVGGIDKLIQGVDDFSAFIQKWIPAVNRPTKPENLLDSAAWAKYLKDLAVYEAYEAAVKSVQNFLNGLKDLSVVDMLAKAVEEPDGWAAKILNWVFENKRDEILDYVVSIVEKFESDSMEQINASNEALKQAAIAAAKAKAIFYAQVKAQENTEIAFDELNQAELDKLNKTPWRVFKMILEWDKTKCLFEELQLEKVYAIFEEIAEKVEERVVYDEGEYHITSESCEVLTPSQLAE